MNKIKISFIVLLMQIGLAFAVKGQDPYSLATYQPSVAYYSNITTLIEPVFMQGIKLGADVILKEKYKENKNVNKAWKTGGYLIYYRYAGNHKGYMFTGEFGRQRIGNPGFISEFNCIAGYMIAHREFAEYDLIPEKENTSHFVYGLNFGIGWDFQKNLQFPLSVVLSPHVYMQTPYKTDNILRVGMELKFMYLIKNEP